MDKEISKTISQTIKKILELLEIKAEVKIEEKEEVFNVNLQTENPGILIGYHGETLFSLQLILGMIIYRKLGRWVRVVIDVGDYRAHRREVLERMALSAAQKVKFSQEEYIFPPMSSAERRIIHLALANNPDVTTESRDEGFERRVVVKPRNVS